MAVTAPERVVRVLIVDDDEDDFFLTRDLLREIPGMGYQVDWQPNVDAALEAICSGAHDVYLIDYRLGPRTGLDVIGAAQGRNCLVPMILLTGQGEPEIDLAAMRAGAADYLEKGKFDSTLLERSIRYSIQSKQSEEQLEKRVAARTAELAETNAALQREVRERLRAEDGLREANRRKDEFLATLAHELRNPLAPIRNALEILRLGPGTPQAVERSRSVMERQLIHMVRLIDDLLDISRITRGKIHLQIEKVDLAAIVECALEGTQPLIAARQQHLTVALPERPVRVEADPTRLTQILINLLNNAAKYTEPNGAIQLSGAVEGSWLVLRVRDSGIGLSPEVLPRIFEMFSQVDHTRDRAQGGLGIGLSLVRGLVDLHGGSVEAHSEGLGRGCEFVVRLPLAAARS